jgi:fatty-acyl-CoA synthase
MSTVYGRTIGNVLESLVDRFPNDVALIEQDQQWTFSEVLDEIRSVGQALRTLGLVPGDRVGILMKDCADLVFAMNGALWAGITIVPLNARLSVADHVYILEDAKVKAFLYHGGTADHVEKVVSQLDIDLVLTLGPAVGSAPRLDLVPLARTVREPLGADPGAAVWVQYTGGTTGLPKGVVHSHRTMLTTLTSCAMEFGLAPGDRCAHVAPLTHTGAAWVLPVWLRGGCNILINGFDVDRLLDAMERHRVTVMPVVPTMIQVLLESPRLSSTDLSSLRTIVYGGAPITPSVLRRALAALGPVLLQSYGQVEVFAQISTLGHAEHTLECPDNNRLLESAGRPVAISEVRIADPDGNPVPVGEPGEILVRGPHVFLEYLNKPVETAAAKVDGWLHTGDIGHRDENGYLFITDRKKDMVITGGFNVYPREVELVIDQHPDVAQCCVVGLPDEKWGERVTAVIVAASSVKDRNRLSAEVIAMTKSAKGSVYAPKSVVFVDELPLTTVGKVDKKALVARFGSS